MKKIIFIAAIAFASCGSGDTREGYDSTKASDLNPNSGNEAVMEQAPSGDRGNPDSTIGATTNAKAPDSNATNPNIR
ncbi:MAG: hypothetical protein EOP56_12060 [Sphingobacteriales bacterium]|nr:MAG: hypothetical protein EOP56_12060 [Sphingobacteriales bacterium]